MRRRIMPSVLLFFVLMADTSILPVLTAWPLLPSFTLLTARSLSLYLGRTHGVFYGLIAGLLVDILVGYPLGFLMLLYTISCFVVATIAYLPEDMRRQMGRRLYLRRGVCVFGVLLAGELAIYGYQYFTTARIAGEYFLNIFLRAAIGAAVSVPMGPAVARIVLGRPRQTGNTTRREVKSF